MPNALTPPEPALPTPQESTLAKESSRQLSAYAQADLSVKIGKDGNQIVLPAPAVRLLCRLLNEMAAGNAVTLMPIHAELTTQQAADLLGVSRPFLIKQMEANEIPYRKVGTHRRIPFQNIMAYKQKIDSKRLGVLDELAKQSQELDMGY